MNSQPVKQEYFWLILKNDRATTFHFSSISFIKLKWTFIRGFLGKVFSDGMFAGASQSCWWNKVTLALHHASVYRYCHSFGLFCSFNWIHREIILFSVFLTHKIDQNKKITLLLQAFKNRCNKNYKYDKSKGWKLCKLLKNAAIILCTSDQKSQKLCYINKVTFF